MDERHPLGIPTPTRGGVAEVHAPGRLIRGRRPGLAAYRRRFKTLLHSTGPALSGSCAPLPSSPRAGNATGRGCFKRNRYCQSRSLALAALELAGAQRKRSLRPLGCSWQRAGVRPNVGGGCGGLVPRRLSAFDLDEEVRTESHVAARSLHRTLAAEIRSSWLIPVCREFRGGRCWVRTSDLCRVKSDP